MSISLGLLNIAFTFAMCHPTLLIVDIPRFDAMVVSHGHLALFFFTYVPSWYIGTVDWWVGWELHPNHDQWTCLSRQPFEAYLLSNSWFITFRLTYPWERMVLQVGGGEVRQTRAWLNLIVLLSLHAHSTWSFISP